MSQRGEKTFAISEPFPLFKSLGQTKPSNILVFVSENFGALPISMLTPCGHLQTSFLEGVVIWIWGTFERMVLEMWRIFALWWGAQLGPFTLAAGNMGQEFSGKGWFLNLLIVPSVT